MPFIKVNKKPALTGMLIQPAAGDSQLIKIISSVPVNVEKTEEKSRDSRAPEISNDFSISFAGLFPVQYGLFRISSSWGKLNRLTTVTMRDAFFMTAS